MRGAVLLVLGYYLAQLTGAMARFGQLPDYLRLHPWHRNVWDVLTGMPSLDRALPVVLREPWIEVGHSVPDLPMAEWSVQILPANLLIVVVVARLLSLHWHLARCHCHPVGAILAATGSAGTALASTTLTWIACCSTPSWVVVPAMLGLWIPTALELTPYGTTISGFGLFLLLGGIAIQAGPDRSHTMMASRLTRHKKVDGLAALNQPNS